ncbi:hypothetical protein Tco_0999193 [Tanacetum coccineum]
MSNNNNIQTNMSSALHNAIMEAGGKDRPPMLAPGPAKVKESYATISKKIKKKMDAEVKSVKIILTRIDNAIYSTVDACPNAMEMWKAIVRLKQVVSVEEATPRDNEIEKLMALISMSFKKIYKPTNNNLITSSNTRNKNVDNTPRSDRRTGHVARECKKAKRTRDSAYHKEKMLLCKQEEAGIQLCADWRDDIDDEPEDQELEADHDDDLNRQTKLSKKPNKAYEEANTSLIKDIDKYQIEHDMYKNMYYVKDEEFECAKAYGLRAEQKVTSKKSFNAYTQKIIKLNQKLSEMEKELSSHQKTISTISYEKEEQEKFYKTREDKEMEKVICLEKQVRVLNDIVYKTGQSVQTMNMLNRNCKTSFVKPRYLKKDQSANPRLFDIGCYNDNLALILAPETDKTIRLAQESRSKLRYKWEPKSKTRHVNTNVSFPLGTESRPTNILEPTCTKQMMGNLKLLTNFVEKFLGMVQFGNDQFALILGYGDLV